MDGVAGFDTTRLGVLVAVGSFGYVLKKEERDREREREREEREREREKRERERESNCANEYAIISNPTCRNHRVFSSGLGSGPVCAPPSPMVADGRAADDRIFTLSLSLSLSRSLSL